VFAPQGPSVCARDALPHRDAAAAAAFAIGEFEIASVPTLPKRSPAEGTIAQAIVGLPGVSLGQYGSVAVDPSHLADDVPIETDLAGDAFAGLRAFLDLAGAIHLDGQPVKWQFVGPVTLGVALRRAGLRTDAAFTIAAEAVRQHLRHISQTISDVLPASPQLVMLDEPWLTDLMSDDFPIPPGVAVDLISTGMAALSPTATVGVHCWGPCDIATMLATGPHIISVPATEHLLGYAGYLARFLNEGGCIAWGVVPTDGPALISPTRRSRAVQSLWTELELRGLDREQIRSQSLITPVGGLAGHQVSVARRLTRLTSEVARTVRRPTPG
jgi:methionine synthase II (cobalamin-independent)